VPDERTASERLRLRITESLLRLAEQLPHVDRGPLARLQHIQRHRRKVAKEHFSRTRPPEHAAVRLDQCRLFEVFQREQETTLARRLRSMFAGADRSQELVADFFGRPRGLSGKSSSAVGTLMRSGAMFPKSMSMWKHVPDLPAEIQSISVGLDRLLPSLTLASFDVRLSDRAAEGLGEIQKTCYLPEVIFSSFVPIGRRAASYSTRYPEAVSAAAAMNWRLKFRRQIEAVLKPVLFGYFGSKGARLPALDVFSLTGMPSNFEEYDNWLQTSAAWLGSVGVLRYPGLSTFRHDSVTFNLHVQEHGEEKILTHEVFLPEQDNVAQKLVLENDVLDDLSPVILWDYLADMEIRLFALAGAVYSRITPQLWSRLGSDIWLSKAAMQGAVLAERMQTELGDQSPLLERHFRALEGFIRTMPIAGVRENLHTALFPSLQAKTEQVKKYAELTMRALSQHVAIRNMQVILRLQRQSVLLALIVTVATLLLLWANWDQIARAFHHKL
jgi:hypothetical protein